MTNNTQGWSKAKDLVTNFILQHIWYRECRSFKLLYWMLNSM